MRELIGGDTTRAPSIAGQEWAGDDLRYRDRWKVERWQAWRGRVAHAPGTTCGVQVRLGDAALAGRPRIGPVRLDQESARDLPAAAGLAAARVRLGLALLGLATAAIDISDGLVGDLGHCCNGPASGRRQRAGRAALGHAAPPVESELQRRCVLAGGTTTSCCFTASPDDGEAIAAAGRDCCVA